MGIREYRESMYLAGEGSFYGLLMASMRNADTYNLAQLQNAFPKVWDELKQRYNAPGGCLTQEETDWLMRVLQYDHDPVEEDETLVEDLND